VAYGLTGMWDSFALAFGMTATAVLAALGGLVLLTALRLRAGPEPHQSLFREGEDATVLLFDGEHLVDATPSGYRFLSGSSHIDQPWTGLLERLAPRFDNLAGRLAQVAINGSVVLTATGGQSLALRAEARGGLTKITLVDPERDAGVSGGDILTVQALDHELQDLRAATNAAPFPIWRSLNNGDIVWANDAYMDMAARMQSDDQAATWPLPTVFSADHAMAGPERWAQRCTGPRGLGVYDVVARDTDGGRLHYAMPAHDAVSAEGALVDFKRTLTNIFAELSTGLAVFDAQRNLQTFNPALAELVRLPVDFLLARPTLFNLLDALRDRRMIPEPKDYRSWRHQIVNLEASALRGDYDEPWHLPNGKTFRVVGRPYPNGALALLVHDITDQITRDQLFRAEFGVLRSAIDVVDDALVVFAASGQVVLTNAAYGKMWAEQPKALAGLGGVAAIFEYWRRDSAPHPFWAVAEAAIVTGAAIPDGAHHLRLLDGRALRCRCVALPGGAVAMMFQTALMMAEETSQMDSPALTRHA
jgi:PAS domain-containing protein